MEEYRHGGRDARRLDAPRGAACAALLLMIAAACASDGSDSPSHPTMPEETPALHHTGLNSVDAGAAVEWYLRLWPAASRGTFAGMPAVDAEMDLVIEEVDEAPAGGWDHQLRRPAEQSPFWHIGAFTNTTDWDSQLAAIGMTHLPLFIGPDDIRGVWRSGLSPYPGVATAEQIAVLESDGEPRPGGFSYVAGPDGALFELTGGPRTTPALAHVHFFHEQPMCAANWYVEFLGMSLPPVRAEDGTESVRPPHEPCEAEPGVPGWPSLEPIGTIRQPRASVVHGNGSMSFYPRQCVGERCGTAQPLVPSRGQVLDHVGFSVGDLDAWAEWLRFRNVPFLEEPHDIPEGRAMMIEGPDGLSIELVEVSG